MGNKEAFDGEIKSAGEHDHALTPEEIADRFYANDSEHKCKQCGSSIITVFEDAACTKPHEDQDVCVPCSEFGGPVEDMIDLWEEENGNG